jgi:MoxR-like ATPase
MVNNYEVAFRVMTDLEANITPYTHFENERDRQVLVESAVTGQHILLGGTPGGGKTTIAKAIASSLDLSVGRFQGDPMATTKHVIGARVYNLATGEYEFHEGPIFSDILLADEFNRNAGQTQSAVIEAMQERQVTPLGLETRQLSPHFLVIATQNAKDKTDGINLLTQANTDRFSTFIDLSKPYEKDEMRKVASAANVWEDGSPEQVAGEEELAIVKDAIKKIRRNADPSRLDHAQDIVMEVRSDARVDRRESLLDMGRPALQMMILAAAAAARRNSSVMEEIDINGAARYVLGHRVEPMPAQIRDGISSQELVDKIIAEKHLELE